MIKTKAIYMCWSLQADAEVDLSDSRFLGALVEPMEEAHERKAQTPEEGESLPACIGKSLPNVFENWFSYKDL